MYSFYLLVMRRWDEAIAEGKRALACDPFSVRINQHLGNTFYNARRYDEAIRQYQQTLELDTHNASVYRSLGDVYEQRSRGQEAIEQWRRAADLAADSELAAILSAAGARRGFGAAVRAVAAKSLDQLSDRAKGEYVPAINFARTYLRMSNKEQALRWLKTACEERNVYALTIGSDPLYDSLRTDRRFVKLLQRMKLSV